MAGLRAQKPATKGRARSGMTDPMSGRGTFNTGICCTIPAQTQAMFVLCSDQAHEGRGSELVEGGSGDTGAAPIGVDMTRQGRSGGTAVRYGLARRKLPRILDPAIPGPYRFAVPENTGVPCGMGERGGFVR